MPFDREGESVGRGPKSGAENHLGDISIVQFADAGSGVLFVGCGDCASRGMRQGKLNYAFEGDFQ